MINEMEEYKYKTSIHFNKPIEPQIAKLIREIKARKKFLLKRNETKKGRVYEQRQSNKND